jgi:sugar phosphate isomerase/epimerase
MNCTAIEPRTDKTDTQLGTISLLTSCSRLPLKELRREFQGEISTVELYVFRKPDLLDLGLDPSSSRNLVDILAEYTPDDMPNWARILKRKLGLENNEPDALRPVTFATFLPQIASPYRKDKAVKALKNVLALAVEMDVRCVEMVCGRVSEHCPGLPREGRKVIPCEAIFYQSRKKDPGNKFDIILGALAELRDFAKTLSKPVAVALEVEPGPLYVLKNLEHAGDMLERTSGREWILDKGKKYHFVGLNVDIGHMLICHEKRATAWQGIPLSRVYNFHISDNAELHFADLVPGMIHSIHPEAPGSFCDWLRCFRCTCEHGNKAIFRNNVSIELEACPAPHWTEDAIRNTKYMLRELEYRSSVDPDWRYTRCDGCPMVSKSSMPLRSQ